MLQQIRDAIREKDELFEIQELEGETRLFDKVKTLQKKWRKEHFHEYVKTEVKTEKDL